MMTVVPFFRGEGDIPEFEKFVLSVVLTANRVLSRGRK